MYILSSKNTLAKCYYEFETFDNLNNQLKPYTKELAYHIVGDPLF